MKRACVWKAGRGTWIVETGVVGTRRARVVIRMSDCWATNYFDTHAEAIAWADKEARA